MLSIDELICLEEVLRSQLDDRLTEILTRLNRNETLEQFLNMIGMADLLAPSIPLYKPYATGKIVILGAGELNADVIRAIFKANGIDKNRLELVMDYDEIKHFDCRKMQWNESYCLVLAGPMPHSGAGKGDHGSILSALEQETGYPPVIRLGENGLKITKSTLKAALQEAISQQWVA